jgi:hypothetical protein
MKKLFPIILVLCSMWSGSAYSKIIFRALCDNPEGVSFSRSIAHLRENKVLKSNYEKDKFVGDDKIEIIYDNNKLEQIQIIWGTDNRTEKLTARNNDFYHWSFIKQNIANGFYYGHWSLSLPNKTLTYYKGNTHKDSISTGINNGMYSSNCEIK